MRPEEAITGALGVLRGAGIEVKGGTLEAVELIDPDHLVLRRLAWRPTSPTALSRWCRGRFEDGPDVANTLFVAPVTHRTDETELMMAASERRLNLVVLDPPRVIISGNSIYEPAADIVPRRPPRRGRLATGRWALERVLLLADGPLTQGELAAAAGISQQAVSHALRMPRNQGYVRSTPQGFLVPAKQRHELLEDWLSDYPGTSGMRSFWYGLDTPLEQGRKVASYAAEMDVQVLLSGDIASDAYAPWRTPVAGIAYLPELLDLTVADLVPATVNDATFTAVVPRDHTLWATARSSGRPGLVDPVIAVHDLNQIGGPDVDQAVKKLIESIVKHEL